MISKEELKKLTGKKIIVLGDLMLDEYIHGSIERISPEAPVPILLENKRSYRLGGAANVALNIQSMGSYAYLIGVIGNDRSGERMSQLIAEHKIESTLIIDESRPTTLKTRLIAHGQQVLRVDNEVIVDVNSTINESLINHLLSILKNSKVDGLIMQDYNKGVLNKDNIQQIIRIANRNNIPIFVDPKNRNFFEYKGVTIFKPNKTELNHAISIEGTLAYKMQRVYETLNPKAIICTLASEGIAYFTTNTHEIIQTERIDVVDVSGAGDSAISAIVLAYLSEHNINKICHIANLAGKIACKKAEVSPVSIDEMIADLKYE